MLLNLEIASFYKQFNIILFKSCLVYQKVYQF